MCEKINLISYDLDFSDRLRDDIQEVADLDFRIDLNDHEYFVQTLSKPGFVLVSMNMDRCLEHYTDVEDLCNLTRQG
ncbi:MAG: hypothetical protein ACXQTE_02120, partial [Methanosarcinaceae archaeon]